MRDRYAGSHTVSKKRSNRSEPQPAEIQGDVAATAPTASLPATTTAPTDPTAPAVPSTESTTPVADPANPRAKHFAFRALRAAKWLLTEYDLLGGTQGASAVGSGEGEEDAAATPIDEVAAELAATPTLLGHSSVLAVPEVLGLLATLQKSGTVQVWNEHAAFRIEMKRGSVVSAQTTSADPDLRLGTILVEVGAIDAAALQDFVDHEIPRGKRMGDALVDAGKIDRATLSRAVAQQAQKVFHAAYDLRGSWYRFDPDCRDEEHDRGMSMTQLLLESARRHDEGTKPPG